MESEILDLASTIDSETNPANQAMPLPPCAVVRLGDAFDLVCELAPNTVDLILTSPPYWGQRTYGSEHNWDIVHDWEATGRGDAIPPYQWYRDHGGILGLEPIPEWYVQHLTDIICRATPALKPSGSMWINLGDTYFARWASIRENGRQGLGDNPRTRRRVPMGGYRQEKQLLQIPARFAISMQDRRWILRNDVIWYKPNVPPRPESDRLRLAHEHFYHFVHRPKEGRAKYFYDQSHNEPGGNDVVIHSVRSGDSGHTATFPESLILPRVLTSCPPGGLVLDPFCGTGRTLCVALDSGRSALGFDNNPHYVSVARTALSERTRNA